MTLIPGGRLILATHNAGKIAEFGALLSPLGVTITSAGEAGLAEPEETGTTFEENAALKAEAARDATGLPALADDSGLAVDALNGDPGIYSARWSGPDKDFSVAMARVLALLNEAGCGDAQRRGASFIVVLALARPGEETLFFKGVTRGVIASAPRGSQGFGYDPIFIPEDGDGRSFGEMDKHEKHGIETPLSHRARAVANFMKAVTREAAS
ncbi:MAG: RdgB/HAM1 family non-canonical purine NTP pyrophosphatase [Pseudomonadota bacterium]